MGFNLFEPEVSKVAKSTDGFISCIYGLNGSGKTPAVCKAEKPLYLAFGKSGLSGLNGIPFFSINSWSEFRQFTKSLTNKNDFEKLHGMYQTIILDEMEVLWKYCESYICAQGGVTKIKDGNNGYGLWLELTNEWESQMLKLIGSGFCVTFILHAMQEKDGEKMIPVGDAKRMLPIILNHSEVIGYVKDNGVDPETGKPIHSSLMLVGTDQWMARTRNEYFDPYVKDFTFPNLVQAYYDALDRQEAAEGIAPITKEERDKQYENEEIPFEELMAKVNELGMKLHAAGKDEELTDIIESVLGTGKKVSQCTKKQHESVEVIYSELEAKCEELGL